MKPIKQFLWLVRHKHMSHLLQKTLENPLLHSLHLPLWDSLKIGQWPNWSQRTASTGAGMAGFLPGFSWSSISWLFLFLVSPLCQRYFLIGQLYLHGWVCQRFSRKIAAMTSASFWECHCQCSGVGIKSRHWFYICQYNARKSLCTNVLFWRRCGRVILTYQQDRHLPFHDCKT